MERDPERIARLIGELKHPNRGRRADAAWELGEIGDPAAVLPLCRALSDWSQDDPREMVRSEVTEALLKIGAPAVLPLCDVVRQGKAGARERAVELLGMIGDPRAVLPLCDAMRHKGTWDVRARAARALGKVGAPAVLPLCEALQDEDPEVSSMAAEALAMIGDNRAVPALCAALREKDESVSSSAAFALGEIGDPNAVHALCEALQQGSLCLRFYAAQALGQIGDPQAVLPLHGICNDPNAAIRAQAIGAIGRIVLREPAAEALVRRGAAAVLPLCAVLKDRDAEARAQAARLLARIAGRDPAPELRAALPPLRQLLAPWRIRTDEEEQVYRNAWERIEAATAAMDLPLPAAPPAVSPEGLPIPAARPVPDVERLPVPAEPAPSQGPPSTASKERALSTAGRSAPTGGRIRRLLQWFGASEK